MYKIIAALCLFVCCSTVQAAPMIGKEGTVKRELIAVCVSQDAYDNWIKASVANDKDGLMELAVTQQCFFAEKGARVLVIEKSWTILKVRIKSGRSKGRAGWTANEFIE